MRRPVLLVIALFASFSDAAELENVVKSAFKQSWEVENAQFLKLNADAAYTNSIGAFLPSLSVSTKHGFQGGEPDTGNDKVAEYAIEAKTLLFSMAQFDAVGLARTARTLQHQRFDEAKNQFCLDAANLYLSFLLEKKRASNLDNIVSILERQFEYTASEYKQGLRPRKDYLRLRTELRGTQLEAIQQQVNLKAAEDKLRDKIRAEFARYSYNPASLGAPEIRDFDEEPTVESIKEKSLQTEIDFLDQQRDKSGHEAWPRVTLGANYKVYDSNYWRQSYYGPDRDRYWSITLGLEYNIWDWGNDRRGRETAVRTTLIRENEAFQEMRNARIFFDLSREKLKIARKVYTDRSLLLGDERESYGLISRDYREGRINFLDYVSSVRSFGRAELSVFEGLVELNRSYFEILLHKGELDAYFQVR